jgi:hypothetical protein
MCGDHIRALETHVGPGFFDLVISNDPPASKPPKDVQWVVADEDLEKQYAVYRANVADPANPGHHKSDRLSQLLIDLLQERTGPLASKDA